MSEVASDSLQHELLSDSKVIAQSDTISSLRDSPEKIRRPLLRVAVLFFFLLVTHAIVNNIRLCRQESTHHSISVLRRFVLPSDNIEIVLSSPLEIAHDVMNWLNKRLRH